MGFELLVRAMDNHHDDPDKDRRGSYKKGYPVLVMPLDTKWGSKERPPKFIVVRCEATSITPEQIQAWLSPWKDDLDYEVVAERPVQGEYDIRIFEKNAGAINQNAIVGVKATRVRNYLLAWGCSNFALSETDGSFTFSLWDAVRSANFWDVPLLALNGIVFSLNSYNSQTGVAEIDINYEQTQIKPAMVASKIEEQGGTVLSAGALNCVFTINRSDILSRFRADVKRRLEQVYMRRQYYFLPSQVDAVIAAGGRITVTKAQLVSALQNKLAET